MNLIRKCKFLVIILFTFFMNSYIVFSFGVGGGIHQPSFNSGGGGGGTMGNSAIPLASGYRVSIVDRSGKLAKINNKTTHSVDYWSQWKGYYTGKSYDVIEDGFNTYFTKYHRANLKFVSKKSPKTDNTSETKIAYDSTTFKKIYFNKNEVKADFFVEKYYSYLKTIEPYKYYPSIRDKEIAKSIVFSDCSRGYTNYYIDSNKQYHFFGVTKGASYCGYYNNIDLMDPFYSNNYVKYALEVMSYAASKEGEIDSNFSKLLSDCGVNGSISSDVASNTYLIIEPLIAVEYRKSNIYIGTLYDLYRLGYPYYTGSDSDYASYNYSSVVNPVVFNTNLIKNNKNQVILKACKKSDSPNSYDNRISNLVSSNGCSGVFSVTMDEIIKTPPCSDVASSYWESINKGEIKVPGQSKATLFKNTIIGKLKNDGAYSNDYAWLANFDKYGYTWDSLGDLLSTTCDFNCNAAVRNIFNTSSGKKKDIKNMIKTNSKYSELRKKMTGGNTYYYELYGEGINVDGKNLCAPVTCNEALVGTMSTFVPSIGKRVNNSVELTASQFTSEEQKSVLQGLYNIFNDKDYLNPENVFSLRYIACKEIDSCYPEMEVDARCVSNGKTFTLYDSNKIDKCIKSGIAYNNKRANGTIAGSGNINESSVDIIDGNGKCREKVSFTFPGDETGIKAGTVFTWGTGRSITGQPKTEIFGTMTVERTCYLNGKSSISMKWADNNINPKIALYYKEAIPNSVTSYTSKKINGTNLTIENITKKIDVYTDESGTQRIGGNNSGKVVNCGGNCNNAKRVDMKASYDIKYGPSFLWSYNRNLNDTGLTLEKSDSENNYYTAIGYGLPTSFVTPTGMKGNYEFGSTVTSNDSNGYMYVKVNNVGTCKNSASNECHFNKSLTFAVTDDNAADKTSIYYKCKFDIENELFGTEDGHDTNPNEPPKGLDVVFRTVQLINKNVSDSEKEVELNKAFPGRSGNGRYTSRDRNNNRVIGSNWLTIENNEADNTKRIFEILSNMVYAQEPAYHIVLDTTKINYIRRNNATYRNADFDPYTSNQRYKFDKNNSLVYAYGASDFITELINTNWLDGVCASGDTDARAKRGACRQS